MLNLQHSPVARGGHVGNFHAVGAAAQEHEDAGQRVAQGAQSSQPLAPGHEVAHVAVGCIAACRLGAPVCAVHPHRIQLQPVLMKNMH